MEEYVAQTEDMIAYRVEEEHQRLERERFEEVIQSFLKSETSEISSSLATRIKELTNEGKFFSAWNLWRASSYQSLGQDSWSIAQKLSLYKDVRISEKVSLEHLILAGNDEGTFEELKNRIQDDIRGSESEEVERLRGEVQQLRIVINNKKR